MLWHGLLLSPLLRGIVVGATARTDALREAGTLQEPAPSESLCIRRDLSDGLLRKRGARLASGAGRGPTARVLQKLTPLRRARCGSAECSRTGGVAAYRSYLVDPASSHMLVSKIKPCMSKYIQFIL